MNRFSIILALSFLAAVSGCNRTHEYNLGEARLVISVDGASQTLRLLAPATRTLPFRVNALSKSDASLVIDLAVDASLVEAYNAEHGTSYAAPPAGVCSFDNAEVVMPRYNDYSTSGSITINSDYLPEGQVCLIPLVLGGVKGKEDVTCDPHYLFVERVNIVPAKKLSKGKWKMVYFDSECPENYVAHHFVRQDNPSSSVTGWALDLIDGDLASIWASDYKNDSSPFHFVIDLGAQYTIRQIDLWAQRGDKQMGDPTNTVPSRQCATATVEFATEIQGDGMGDLGGSGNAKWFGAETFGPDVLKNQISNTLYLSELQYARYVRFTYHNCYYSASDVSPRTSYTAGSLAELDFWGYNASPEDVIDGNIPEDTPVHSGPRAIFVGDSITWLWGLETYSRDVSNIIYPLDPLPSWLTISGSKADIHYHPSFFSGNDYVAAGHSGWTSSQLLSVFETEALNPDPQCVVIMAGTNDLAQGVSETNILGNLDRMARLAADRDIKVVLCSVTPCNDAYSRLTNPNTKGAHILTLNGLIRQYASENGFAWCDYHPSLVAADGLSLKDEYCVYDHLHPNPDAMTIMEGIVDPIVKSLTVPKE